MLFSERSIGEPVTIVLQHADGTRGRTVEGIVKEANVEAVVIVTSNGHEQRIRRGRVSVYVLRPPSGER